jgi:hypothetical protein
MKTTKPQSIIVAAAIATMTSSVPLLAQDYRTDSDRHAQPLFREQELQLDLFGTLSVGQETLDDITRDRVTDDGRLGAGVGLNYFFSRNVGFGADAYTENANHCIVDNASGNLIVRFPFEGVQLAPYVFGGGGRQFDPEELWFAQFGGGLEVRVTPSWGLFADARYMFLEDDADCRGLGRLGLRFAF